MVFRVWKQSLFFKMKNGWISEIQRILFPKDGLLQSADPIAHVFFLSRGRLEMTKLESFRCGRQVKRKEAFMKKIKSEKNEREKYLNKDYGDVLASLKPVDLALEFSSPTESISIRLPRVILNQIRILADEQDIPYQSLIKIWLADKVKKETAA